MSEPKKSNSDPKSGSFWRHLPSGELYKVALVAANPNSGERVVVYATPKDACAYYQRPMSEFQKKFIREVQL